MQLPHLLDEADGVGRRGSIVHMQLRMKYAAARRTWTGAERALPPLKAMRTLATAPEL